MNLQNATALVTGGSSGIGKAIGDHDGAAIKRGLNNFPNELAAAGFKKEQLGLRCHRHTLRRELQKMANPLADRRSTRFAGDKQRHASCR